MHTQENYRRTYMNDVKVDKHKAVVVCTDGACSNNPNGPGGWAATMNFRNKFEILSGHNICATNNMMELTAVVRVIKHLVSRGYKRIIVNSDSAYVINAINKGWVHDWKKRGWKTKQNEPIANSHLWKELYIYLCDNSLFLSFNKVKGHSGHTFNEIADVEAKREVEMAKLKLQSKSKK